MADLLQVVSQANADKIVAESFIDSFIGAVGRQDRKAVGTYAAVFASRGLITPEGTRRLRRSSKPLRITRFWAIRGSRLSSPTTRT